MAKNEAYTFSLRLTGETVIYGKVLNVNQKDLKLMLQLNNSMLACKIDSKTIAEELAERLNREVGLAGQATWSANGALEEFTVTGITQYEEGSYVEALNQLSKLVGKYFDDIDDVEAYIQELRS